MAEDSDHATNIKKLQEIFDSTITEAENAYNYYNKDLEAAIQGLSSQQEMRYGPENKTSDATSKLAASSDEASGSSTNNPIDLTSTAAATGGEDDLEKALKLSLLDMGRSTGGGGVARGGSGSGEPISQEEQDLSRALEASLADTQGDMKRLGMSYSSYEPLNPHERKRVDINPVGLKNIGNTCWFSSVIQSLFYIPQFRDCILNYTVPQLEDQPACVKFVEELQKLFALLLNSNQKYINPKPALDVVHSVFNNASGAQQDVSEFTHKLLEWMEDAFSHSLGSEKSNPIVDLFTGQCVTEGLLNEQQFVNKSQFGAFPVQVEGHAHLHDSLEAATVNTEMQQETWFTHLPPVLVIELSRFKYNQNTGQAEKIHDQLTFDLDLHLDRYLHVNCHETRKRRTEVDKLRKQIAKLSSTIRSYTNYQDRPLSIHEVLQLVINFLNSRVSVNEDGDAGLIPIPKSGSKDEMSKMEFNLRRWMAEIELELSDLNHKLSASLSSLSTVYSDPAMNCTPYRLHAVLVHQGEASGGHYWAYVRRSYDNIQQVSKGDIELSQEAMAEGSNGEDGIVNGVGSEMDRGEELDIDDDEKMDTGEEGKTLSLVNMIGDDDDLLDQPPPLPPPLTLITNTTTTTSVTTCGQVTPAGGVVVNGGTKDWLKCNDISVTEVDWAEVMRESFGRSNFVSTSNTSAYCLVYINDKTAQDLVKAKASSVDTLNDKLIKYVIESNQSFIKTLEDYDLKQAQKKEESNNKDTKNGGSVNTEYIKPAKNVRFKSSNPDITEFANRMIDSSPSEAKRARPDISTINNKIQIESEQYAESISTLEVDPALTMLLRQKLQTKLQSFSVELPVSMKEGRLLHIFHYATDCGFSEYVKKALLLEAVTVDAREDDDTKLKFLSMKEFMNTVRSLNTEKELKLVKDMYKLLCGVCHHCCQAVNCIQRNDWCNSLPHVFKCYSMNTAVQNMHSSHSALNNNILAKLRAQVVLMASHQGTDYFNSGQITQCTNIANTLIVPAIKELTATRSSFDEEVIEKVRGDWCNCLGTSGNLTEDDSDKLADLLGKILDEVENSKSGDLELPDTPNEFDSNDLVAHFTNAYNYLLTEIIPDQ